MEGLGPAPKHAGVSGLKTNARRIDGHIRPGLIDHGHHPKGSGLLSQQQIPGDGPLLNHPPHRVGQIGQVLKGAGHGLSYPVDKKRVTDALFEFIDTNIGGKEA